jgi:hypothetical protein
MLKRAVVCTVIVVAAAMGWQQLRSVPDSLDVGTGTHITWGEGSVWGMFPTRNPGDTQTYVAKYDPGTDVWTTLGEPMETSYLKHTSLTFQWLETPTLWGIGVDPDTDAYLYSYHTDYPSWGWDFEYIDPDEDGFPLGNGTCIAYVPNASYDSASNPVPGWIYCLPGGGSSFYRYWIPSIYTAGLSVYGYNPGPGVTIADATPPFKWSPWGTPTQYRIQVSTNPSFIINVIDTILLVPELEPTAKLANGTYYWRAAYRIGMVWSWSSTHSFVLQAGWERLDSVPQSIGTGAAMAFDADALVDSAIIALRGGGHRNFYEYNIESGHWVDTLQDAPVNVTAGTSLTTHDPTGEWALHPCAAFGGSDTSDCPYHYHPDWADSAWVPFDTTDTSPVWNSHFPEHLGSEASMVAGTDHMNYLVVGDSNHFYRLEPPAESRGGGQAGVVRNARVKAFVVSGLDRIEVEYDLPVAAHVRAVLRDAVGRRVGAADAGGQKAGVHRLSVSRDQAGRKLAAGAYFVLLDTGMEQATLKTVVR